MVISPPFALKHLFGSVGPTQKKHSETPCRPVEPDMMRTCVTYYPHSIHILARPIAIPSGFHVILNPELKITAFPFHLSLPPCPHMHPNSIHLILISSFSSSLIILIPSSSPSPSHHLRMFMNARRLSSQPCLKQPTVGKRRFKCV